MVDIPGLPYDAVTDVEDLSGNGKGVALNVWPSDNRVPLANDPVPLDTFVLDQGELAYALDSERLRVGDGYTPGGDEVAYMGDFYELRDEFIVIRDALLEALNGKANLDGGNNFTGDQDINGVLTLSGYAPRVMKFDGENIYMDATDAYPTIFYTTDDHTTQVGAIYGPTVGDPMMYLQADGYSFGSGDESLTWMAFDASGIVTTIPLDVGGDATVNGMLTVAGVFPNIWVNGTGTVSSAWINSGTGAIDVKTVNSAGTVVGYVTSANTDAAGEITTYAELRLRGSSLTYHDQSGVVMTVTRAGGIAINGSTVATVSQLANYLPLTGGTLSGPLTVNGAVTAYPFASGNSLDMRGFENVAYMSANEFLFRKYDASVSFATINAGGITVTGSVTAKSAIAGHGSIDFTPGTVSNSGYVAVYAPGGARAGYMGNANASGIEITAEGGRAIGLNSTGVYSNAAVFVSGQIVTNGAGGCINIDTRDTGNNWLQYVSAGTLNFYSGSGVRASLDGTGINIPTGSTYKVNGVPITGGAADDTAYGPSWDGVTTVAPSKNAVYDKIQALIVGGGSLTDGDYGDVLVASSGASLAVQSLTGVAGVVDFAQPNATLKLTDAAGFPEIIFTGNAGGVHKFSAGSILGYHTNGSHSFQVAAAAKFTIAAATLTAAVPIVVPDEVYGAAWNGSLQVPSKNAVYDQIELKANTSALANYLPLTGGTITGALHVNSAAPSLILRASAGSPTIRFRNAGDTTTMGEFVTSAASIYYKAPSHTFQSVDATATFASIDATNNFLYANTTYLGKQIAPAADCLIHLRNTNVYSIIHFKSYATDGTGESVDARLVSYRPGQLWADCLNSFRVKIAFVDKLVVDVNGAAVTGILTATGRASAVGVYANKNGAAESVNRNPGVSLFDSGGVSAYGLELGYSGGNYGVRLYTDLGTPIILCGLAGGGATQASFTDWAKFSSAGLDVIVGTIKQNGSAVATVSQLANYLPLTGGTISSDLTVNGQSWFNVANFKTPNSGSTGAIRVLGNLASGLGYIQVVDSTATVQWGFFQFVADGSCTWSGQLKVTDEAYGPAWNGKVEVPTKNAVYDKIESLAGGGTTQSVASTSALTVASTDRIATVSNLAVAMSIWLQAGSYDGQRTTIMIKDNGTTRVLSWTGGIATVRAAIPGVLGATIAGKWVIYDMCWNTTANCWFILGEHKEA